jgi:DNA-binding transcriptional MocR family regulator
MKKYEIVIDYIRKSIRMGRLYQGDYLPSIRMMSQMLGVSTLTVYDAYCRLEREGLVESNERRGFVVLDDLQHVGSDATPQYIDEDLPTLSAIHADHFKNTTRRNSETIPLGAMAPKNKYFPSEELSKCLVRAIRSNPYDMNTNGLAVDLEKVTAVIEKMTAKYMFITSGIAISDEEVRTTNSTSEGLLYALSATTKSGDMVVVESPGFIGIHNIIRFLRLISLEIPTLQPNGLDIDKLELLLNSGIRPSALVVTPNFHNPTGALMPLENRQRLLALCGRYSIVVIEDDVLGPLYYEKPVPSLKSLRPNDVIYVSSYSKVLAPGYRVGWLCGGKYTESIGTMRTLGAYAMTKFSQLAVAQYLAEGKVKSYLPNLRKKYEDNRDVMAQTILGSFPENTDVFIPQGGQYLWATMPGHVVADELYFKAMERNILLAPGMLFTKQNLYRNCLRFCYAQEITQKTIDAIEYTGQLAGGSGKGGRKQHSLGRAKPDEQG